MSFYIVTTTSRGKTTSWICETNSVSLTLEISGDYKSLEKLTADNYFNLSSDFIFFCRYIDGRDGLPKTCYLGSATFSDAYDWLKNNLTEQIMSLTQTQLNYYQL